MIEKLLREMSLMEKVGQMNQRLYGWEVYEKRNGKLYLTDKFKKEVELFGGIGAIYGIYRSDPWSGKDLESGLSRDEGKQLIEMIHAYIKKHTRLKIPPLISEEMPHGVQALGTMTLPSNISVGQTWNPKLVEAAQQIVGYEAYVRGINLGLITCLDVARDPRWGRAEECFSEDPFLTKHMAYHTIKGIQSSGVFAVAKHFAAQGSAEGGLNAAPAVIGDRELREIHLPPLEGVVAAKGRMMMAAYNEIDGVLCHDNPWLLKKVAKDEYGYEGGYMADGVALDRLADLAQDPIEAAARALKSGIDLSLWDNVYPHLGKAVMRGDVSEALLDEAVLRVLKLKNDAGLLGGISKKLQVKVDKKIIHQLTEESFVLIKNENKILPLSGSESLAVIGPNAHAFYNQCGDYTPYKDLTQGYTFYEGLKERFDCVYAKGSNVTDYNESEVEFALAYAEKQDVIVVVFGGSSARDFATEFDKNGAAISGSNEMTCGENIDVSNLSIPDAQVYLIKQLSKLNKPMIGVLVQGRPHALNKIDAYFDALWIGGYPGQYAGLAFAKLLDGTVNPSGRLAMSIPISEYHIPSYYNFKYSHQNEHYIDLRMENPYPFGFGLSYTEFELAGVELLNKLNDTEEVVVCGTLKNIGEQDGSDVVQVYVRRKHSAVIQRVKRLVGFEKVFVKANQSQSFEIRIGVRELMTWLPIGEYELEAGEVKFMVEAQNNKFETVLSLK